MPTPPYLSRIYMLPLDDMLTEKTYQLRLDQSKDYTLLTLIALSM